MVIGITGTSSGLHDSQKRDLIKTLEYFKPTTLIHGMCKGVDTEAHNIVRDILPDCKIIGYPGISSVTGESNDHIESDVDERRFEQTYFKRNRDIVNECDLLIGCPYSKDTKNGGTVYTINYAKKVKKNTLVIHRDDT